MRLTFTFRNSSACWLPLVAALSLLLSAPATPTVQAADAKEEQAANAKKDGKEKKASEKEKDEKSKPKITHGKVEIAGKKIEYTATAGKLPMKTDEGKTKAEVFFVAYTVDAEGDEERPVTFCFNGGPGSSSVWLHLGMLGPQRVKLDSAAERMKPPAKLVANPYSLLDKTDLVFIDPVSTGYSRPAKGEDKSQFHGYKEDVRSISQFIHDYTTKYGRWGSPKFLLGESYGGIRAAGLSGRLQDRYHMYLNGVVMISGVFDFQTLSTSGNNELPYALFLPSYAATAWYHKALPEHLLKKSVEDVVAEAEEFALGKYMQALLSGDSLPDDQRKLIIARMAELTGLSAEYLDRANLRVGMPQFGKELLRDKGLVVGRYDGRYVGHDRDNIGEYTEHDPSGSALFGAFTSAMNQYLHNDLKVDEPRVYEILTGNVHPWNYSSFTNRYVNASETLRGAMADNPYLQVFAACGYYDLATPSFAMEYSRDQLELAPEARDQFRMRYYEGGHMMYVHEPSLKKLRKDLLEFYDDALNAKPEED